MTQNRSARFYFFPALLINQKITTIITITPITPNQTPALKIPAIASQLLSVIAINNNGRMAVLRLILFIYLFFSLMIWLPAFDFSCRVFLSFIQRVRRKSGFLIFRSPGQVSVKFSNSFGFFSGKILNARQYR